MEEMPEPLPTKMRLSVLVDSIASDGSVQNISSHTEIVNVTSWSDEDLDKFREAMQRAAYAGFELARESYISA
jgi:hypothetical protein